MNADPRRETPWPHRLLVFQNEDIARRLILARVDPFTGVVSHEERPMTENEVRYLVQSREDIARRAREAREGPALQKVLDPARNSRDGLVYFIRSGSDGPIKIGFTRNLKTRLSQLQTGHPYKLTVMRAFYGDKSLETYLHQKFRAHRMEGEWFRPDEEIIAYLEERPMPPRRTAKAPEYDRSNGPVLAPESLAAQARALREMLAKKPVSKP